MGRSRYSRVRTKTKMEALQRWGMTHSSIHKPTALIQRILHHMLTCLQLEGTIYRIALVSPVINCTALRFNPLGPGIHSFSLFTIGYNYRSNQSRIHHESSSRVFLGVDLHAKRDRYGAWQAPCLRVCFAWPVVCSVGAVVSCIPSTVG